MLPGKPVGNMYFAAWSHNVISNAVNLSNDLKIGEYRKFLPHLPWVMPPRLTSNTPVKIPPRVMFCTQIYGTILGSFINYAVMISIVKNNRALLVEGNGDSSWSGATMQGYNTNAASWALASYLYKGGATYAMVPVGLAIGAGLVVVHRIVVMVRMFPISQLHPTC